MNQVKLMIFDMDGLLFDTERIAFEALKKAIKNAGYELTLDIYRKIIGAGKQEDEAILKDVYGEDFSFSLVLNDYLYESEKILTTGGLRIMEGVTELLDILDERKIKKCVASSSSLETIHRYLTMANLKDRFDFYMSGDEVARGKPHPDIFLEACQRAGESPETAIVLEDSPNGLRAAYRAGIKCIVVPDLVVPDEEMENRAYRIVTSLVDVCHLFTAPQSK
ncbi:MULTISPECIES: HAD family phosphatase [Clostridia]|uniref:HAD family hydrolase n=1 Tax=Clostridia TaxID=186801 RepID=UPI000EA0BB97|nr:MULTISPECIES: HAD family phosphatase [Clostridia]NBJ68179.1 HAD family phosphatase [Roseburia sp. 1XD42-34]RKI81952.1 HAD family phosphatase [Clostridium sp. 1xD42-85]